MAIRSSFIAETGLKLVRTPSPRRQAARRRLAVVSAILGLGLLTGILGVTLAPHGAGELAADPFSYFPSE